MIKQYPCDVSAEEAVIGSIILDSRSERCQNVFNELHADMFYGRHRQVIFNVLASMNTNQKPIDLVTLDAELTGKGLLNDAGGFSYLADLCKVPTVLNVKAYSETIKNKYLERAALKTLSECQELITSKNGLETHEKLSEVQRLFTSLDETCKSDKQRGLIDLDAISDKWLAEVEQRYTNPDKARGLTVGIKAFDEMLAPKGVVKGSLFVIGARPKMGKTAFLVQMSLNCAMKEGKPAVIFSLEMPSDQLFERMITQVSGVSGDVFYDAEKQETNFNIAMNCVGEIIRSGNVFIDDTPSISLSHIVSECRRLKREKGQLGMIFVDYLTLMKPEKAERNDLAYGIITKGLKALAKELSCVVVLLTQLNRQIESRPDKRPYPSDSRDTGQIEQDCDYWFGLYRDGVYNEQADQSLTEILLRLNRHGKTGSVFVNMKHGQIFEADQNAARISQEKVKEATKKKRYKDDEDDF
ncbi:DnaB-like helicase C-terminal domain-containing protein [Utexia brackfieldae]|uniref:replicative DNA helicase n=1 Tax=Utexia brackfieldae TaxID=3074108 RepID=UPI00370DCDCB